jgi:membrane-associated protease RseP (regulator of RpoE activity)
MRRTWIHILLFILTVASTWFMWGPAYSASIMLILLGHEMGHYLMSRSHGIRATLPFFLPLPLPPFGTLGAVIRMESTASSRRALFDTGVSGPLISFVLSIPAIVIGLRLSQTIPLSQVKEEAFRFASPPLFSFIQHLVMGEIPENHEVMIHPIGYAGWVGLFVTALNLLPVGQLDGGHIAYALFGRRSRRIFVMAIAVIAFFFIFYNVGWGLLLILMILFGRRHPAPSDDQTPLGWKRKLIGGISFIVLVLSFTPAPFPQAPSLVELIEKGPSTLWRLP